MKLLVDVNLTPNWCPALNAAGFEAVHWTEVGEPGAPDVEILDHARKLGMVVFTHDLDFGYLLALTRARGPSVVQLRTQDPLPGAVGTTVIDALSQHADAIAAGALLTIDPRAARVRILPIAP